MTSALIGLFLHARTAKSLSTLHYLSAALNGTQVLFGLIHKAAPFLLIFSTTLFSIDEETTIGLGPCKRKKQH